MRRISIALLALVGLFASAAQANSLAQTLNDLYLEDQQDKQSGAYSYYRDQQRLESVQALLENNRLTQAKEYYHAAVIFQHGSRSEHYRRAHTLALEAVRLEPGFMEARWLACAAEDRYLHSLGKPQVWGTQQRFTGSWTLEPFDRSAKSDRERQANGVSNLEAIDSHIETLNGTELK
ncbi:hypothetical protein [Ferrimonas sp. YFM]|uniref:hypothetical protein n=1 Tax=Ferrimonas sp. YFM TaxID=3028878 RepID=UPI002573FDA5|nr:hypothetical protein [Ferrimonas sp. YFM]BDY05354.1 hypothetical protein F0521_23950 [Ferrimonas sp. YFM]